jgi:ABC-2 type transport system ATP-binding protein
MTENHSASVLEAQGLSKVYGSVQALKALDLRVGRGEIYCLLGANGAGKTTTINLFLGFIEPSAGSASVCGIDVQANPISARHRLAYIPETVMLYGNLSGYENLEYFARLSGKPPSPQELRDCLLRAGLTADAHDRPLKGYSKGMRQKVGVAIALAKRADALLLDEPTSGLDPKASNEFSQLILGLAQGGAAILMATHDLFRARETGSRIGIMREGTLRAEYDARALSPTDLERVYLEQMQGDD